MWAALGRFVGADERSSSVLLMMSMKFLRYSRSATAPMIAHYKPEYLLIEEGRLLTSVTLTDCGIGHGSQLLLAGRRLRRPDFNI